MKINNKLQGKAYWRSLDQLADTPEFQKFLHREFPENASELTNPLTRRKFLTLMGASIAFAGLAGCRKPVEKIVPYVNAPENIVPGIPQHYATAMPFGLNAYGLVVESHEGRPTKIEGNEKHPSTQGKSNAIIQASILGLYDPDRSKSVQQNNIDKSWNNFVTFWREQHLRFSGNQGQGLVIFSESFASPTLYRLHRQFMKQFPRARWLTYEAVSDENIYDGLRKLTGRTLQPVHHFEKAKVILSLESDFLLTESENIRANLGFSQGRQVESEKDDMNRLYVVENTFSVTGGMADHRLRLRSAEIADFTVALARELQKQGLVIQLPLDEIDNAEHGFNGKWIKAAAADLIKHRGESLVVAGKRQPAFVHALVFAINDALANTSMTVEYKEPENALLPSKDALLALKSIVENGEVQTLITLGGNPVYNSPGNIDFENLLGKVKTSIHIGPYFDETAGACQWHVPLAHYLESWGDTRAADGTLSIVQPLIAPLFGGHSYSEIFELLASGKDERGYNVVRETWKNILPPAGFEDQWRKVLHDGILENSAARSQKPSPDKGQFLSLAADYRNKGKDAGKDNLEVVFQASPALYDGRFANNGWLQEMPDSITKLAWDNAVLISPATAKAFGLQNMDKVSLELKERTIEMPVWIQPGQADFSVVLNLGYGRTAAGQVGNGVGFNTYKLRQTGSPDIVYGGRLTKLNGRYKLANTQDHGSMEGRPLVREASLDHYREHPEFAPEMVEHPPLKSLWDEFEYDEGYQWGMTIDLNTCSGCNACVIACQSENNIPVVGKEQVFNGREMHWIRLDRYYSGDLEEPEMVYQPVACQHCEMAPCEQVCPVQATVHDGEGLNVMTYNRCVGTRYCSNNCPYKVRRFNFFNYTNEMSEIIQMAQNPDVTVRSRGVMEKCTFCTQRINQSKITAKNEGRILKDGEVKTACQQSCPANAIVFGNINDPDSAVSRIKKQNRNYTMLGELNLKTRNTFLAKLRNPNPALVNMGEDIG